jgi:hypothetical protein
MREGDWKLVRPFVSRKSNPQNSDLPPLLFDVARDPLEANDLAPGGDRDGDVVWRDPMRLESPLAQSS